MKIKKRYLNSIKLIIKSCPARLCFKHIIHTKIQNVLIKDLSNKYVWFSCLQDFFITNGNNSLLLIILILKSEPVYIGENVSECLVKFNPIIKFGFLHFPYFS